MVDFDIDSSSRSDELSCMVYLDLGMSNLKQNSILIYMCVALYDTCWAQIGLAHLM